MQCLRRQFSDKSWTWSTSTFSTQAFCDYWSGFGRNNEAVMMSLLLFLSTISSGKLCIHWSPSLLSPCLTSKYLLPRSAKLQHEEQLHSFPLFFCGYTGGLEVRSGQSWGILQRIYCGLTDCGEGWKRKERKSRKGFGYKLIYWTQVNDWHSAIVSLQDAALPPRHSLIQKHKAGRRSSLSPIMSRLHTLNEAPGPASDDIIGPPSSHTHTHQGPLWASHGAPHRSDHLTSSAPLVCVQRLSWSVKDRMVMKVHYYVGSPFVMFADGNDSRVSIAEKGSDYFSVLMCRFQRFLFFFLFIFILFLTLLCFTS